MTFTHKVNSIYHSQKETLEEVLLYIIHSLLLAFQTLIAKVLFCKYTWTSDTCVSYQGDSSESNSVLDFTVITDLFSAFHT